MITFIHGDDVVASRNFILKVKSETKAETFYADSQEPHILLQLAQGAGLFGENKTLVVENVFSKKALTNLKFLEDKSKSLSKLDLYIWEAKELSKPQLSAFGKSESRLFKIPQKLFIFLDSISPNSPRNITLFHEALEGTEEELVFFMMIRQFRLMLNLTDESYITDEVKRLAPWQKSKLATQSKKFGSERLVRAYKKLYEIESKIKVGNLNFPLVSAIDIFLLDL